MSYIAKDGIFQAEIKENWNFKIGKEFVQEDMETMIKLITFNGKNKEPMEQTMMALLSMFSSVEGLYEMFKIRLEAFNFEKKKKVSINNYIKSNFYRDAFNYIGVSAEDYNLVVKRIATELEIKHVQQNLEYINNNKKLYSFSVLKEITPQKIIEINSTKKIEDNTAGNIADNTSVSKEAILNIDNIVDNKILRKKIIDDYEKKRNEVKTKNVKNIVNQHYRNFLLFSNNRLESGEKQTENEEQAENTENEEQISRKIEVEVEMTKENKNNLNITVSADLNSSDMLKDHKIIDLDEKKDELVEDLKEQGFSDEIIKEKVELFIINERKKDESDDSKDIDMQSFDYEDYEDYEDYDSVREVE